MSEIEPFDVDDFLMHYGMKGMQWGVRNERRAESAKQLVDSKKSRMEKSKEVRAKSYEAKKAFYKKGIDKVKNASPETKKKVAIGATIAVGTVATAALLKARGAKSFKDMEDSLNSWDPDKSADVKVWIETFTQAYDSYVPS